MKRTTCYFPFLFVACSAADSDWLNRHPPAVILWSFKVAIVKLKSVQVWRNNQSVKIEVGLVALNTPLHVWLCSGRDSSPIPPHPIYGTTKWVGSSRVSPDVVFPAGLSGDQLPGGIIIRWGTIVGGLSSLVGSRTHAAKTNNHIAVQQCGRQKLGDQGSTINLFHRVERSRGSALR